MAKRQTHVEPFETVAELSKAWYRPTPILVHDTEDVVASILQFRSSVVHWFPVLVYHQEPNTADVVRSLRQGVLDYLVWPFTPAQLSKALGCDDEIKRQSLIVDRELRARKRLDKLTSRECQVLLGMIEGLPSRQIAEVFNISTRTVETHRANLMRKLDVASTAQAIRLAIEGGLGNASLMIPNSGNDRPRQSAF